MSSTASASSALRVDVKVIGLISTGHCLSHLFQIIIPSLFLFIKDDFGVSYSALGFSATLMFAAGGLMQVPAGFLVDRIGGRKVLIGGLTLLGTGIVLAGLAPNYALFTAALVVAGAGNSVFHPADFAILNARIGPGRIGHAFSVHGVGGSLGYALAPPLMLALGSAYGWRAAAIGAGVVGILFAAVLASQRELRGGGHARQRSAANVVEVPQGMRTLLTPAVLMCAMFFVLSAFSLINLQSFAVPVMVGVYGVSAAAAGAALSGYLIGNIGGMLGGGFVVTHVKRFGLVAAACILVSSLALFGIALSDFKATGLLGAMTAAGFFAGLMNPSRDTLIRQIAPAESRGKVYGFVYSGLDLGASIGPVIAGWLLDRGDPRMVFVASAAALLLCAFTLAELDGKRSKILRASG